MSHIQGERSPLISKDLLENLTPSHQISVVFAAACIIDQFGVNPIIVLPRGIILCGWAGFPLVIFVVSLTIYTAVLLGRCWVIAEYLDKSMALKSRYAYSALTEMAWGKVVGKIVNLLINISVFSSNIPALLIASQNLQFFDVKISNNAFSFSYCYWLVILGVALCPLTWLGSPKDTKWISVFSAFSVLICALLTWICMFSDDTRSSVYDRVPPPNWQEISVTFGILTFQFGCHPSILTIQTDMHNKRKLSRSILISFLVTGGLSLITVTLSRILYGSGSHANLIQGLPINLILYFDLLLVTLQLFLSTIVGQCTLFQDVEDKFGIPRELCWQRCVVRSIIVLLVVVFAEILPRFDLVMGVIGGVLTGPITLIFPPLLYVRFRKLLRQQARTGCRGEKSSELEGKKTPEFESRKLVEVIVVKAPEKVTGRQSFRNDQSRMTRCLKSLTGSANLSVDFDDQELSAAEFFVVLFIVGVGIAQTAMATYYSTAEAVKSTQFLPPCVVDIQAASRIINA